MVKIVATAKRTENVQSVVDNSRTHAIVCDLPVTSGGNDKGPTALELAVMALADCAVTIYSDVAKKSNVEITEAQVVAEAEKREDAPVITGVKLKVKVSGKASERVLRAIWRRTENNCPVLRIFKDSIPIEAEIDATSTK
ncbi:TPA: OsmC family peroxiredoxin [Candidatus Bathyarchaeota archaeon]|nr:OsmC family peroxiredoxin [Candidatus Bathyarchaeota archaeon]